MGRPGFLVIGAHKAGTSWLYKNLRMHPDVWMPPQKELHYFDRSDQYISRKFCYKGFAQRFFCKDYWRIVRRRVKENMDRIEELDLAWEAKYLLGRASNKWYVELFSKAGSRVCGDVTPAYALLNESDIESIRDFLPDIKIIYVMRNPVDRAWSHFKYNNKIDERLDRLDTFFESEDVSCRADYLGTVERWMSRFPNDQFKPMFYDLLESDPVRFLGEISNFLEVDSRKFHLTYVKKRINASNSSRMSPAVRLYLTRKYYGLNTQLHLRFGGYASKWLKDSDDFLGRYGVDKAISDSV